jgi:hypothetical protein
MFTIFPTLTETESTVPNERRWTMEDGTVVRVTTDGNCHHNVRVERDGRGTEISSIRSARTGEPHITIHRIRPVSEMPIRRSSGRVHFDRHGEYAGRY